jgi:hypothetical protein
LTLLGIHTPETAGEARIERVRQKAKDAGLTYPIAVDNTGKTWKAFENRYWPTVYLVDRKGNLRFRWEGELGSKGDKVLRARIAELIAEKP